MSAPIRRNISWSRRFFVVVCSFIALTATSHAQQYKTIAPKVTGGAAKQLRAAAASALRDAANFQAKKQAFNQYFTQVYFPEMTNYAPNALGQLEKRRETLLRTIRGSKVPGAQKQLTDLTYKAMHSIARGDYHPAVRYNAVLILGTLDEKIATAATPAVPLPSATASLLEILANDSFADVKVPSSLKLGALVGLERHARFGVAQELTDKITPVTLKLLALEEPSTDVTLDVHHWMKCQAARVLARLHAKKITPQVHDALTQLMADSNMDLKDRCCVADILSTISYQGAADIDGAAAVTALGNLMKEVASDEAKLAREYEKNKLGGRRQSRSRVEPIYQRDRLASRLRSIALGARSLTAGLPDASKAQLNSLVAPLGPVMKVAEDNKNVDLNVTQAVKKLEQEINAVVDSWKKPADEDKADEADFS